MTALSRRLFLATGLAAIASPAFGQSDVDGMEVELFDHPGITPWGEEEEDFQSLTNALLHFVVARVVANLHAI